MEYTVGSLADLISGQNTANKPKVKKEKVILNLRKSLESTTKSGVKVRELSNQILKKVKVENSLEQEKRKSIIYNAYNIDTSNKVKISPKQKRKSIVNDASDIDTSNLSVNKNNKKGKKRKHSVASDETNNDAINADQMEESFTGSVSENGGNVSVHKKNKKKGKKRKHSVDNDETNDDTINADENENEISELAPPKKKRKNTFSDSVNEHDSNVNKKNKKKLKKKQSNANASMGENNSDDLNLTNEDQSMSDDKDESKLDITDEKTEFERNAERRVNSKNKSSEKRVSDPERDARTVFVGNVPLVATKIKIKKLFAKYGKIDAVRIRGVPVANPKTEKKLALYKKEFHSERNSCCAFVRYLEKEDSVKALEANGMVYLDHHLKVSPCDKTHKQNESKAIFIGNVSFDGEEEDLYKLFEPCGPIENIRLIRDKATGMGKGFGYINFKTSDAVQLALEMGDVTYKGRVLRIKLCNLQAAKKNQKKNVVKEITKAGKPKARSFRRRKPKKTEAGQEVEATDNGMAVEKFAKKASGDFQGAKVEKKKKKNKFNKGEMEKKKMIKQFAPKHKNQ